MTSEPDTPCTSEGETPDPVELAALNNPEIRAAFAAAKAGDRSELRTRKERRYGMDAIVDNLPDEDVLRLWREGKLAYERPAPQQPEDTWRDKAAAAIRRLNVIERMEDEALGDLCIALRSGLTAQQQRTVVQDLLGEPHVGMTIHRSGVRILVPASSARQLAGSWLVPDLDDPWWDT